MDIDDLGLERGYFALEGRCPDMKLKIRKFPEIFSFSMITMCIC